MAEFAAQYADSPADAHNDLNVDDELKMGEENEGEMPHAEEDGGELQMLNEGEMKAGGGELEEVSLD